MITREAVAELGRGSLAVNTLWTFVGQAARIAVQACYIILIARALGPAGFGAFMGVAALVAIVAPFAAMGSGNLLIKGVARDRSAFAKCWGDALIRTAMFGSVFIVAVLLLAWYVLPASMPVRIALFVAVADLLFTQVFDLSAKGFQAVERGSWVARLEVVPAVARLAAAIVLVSVFRDPTAVDWALLYLVGSGVAACLAVAATLRELGRPIFDRRSAIRELSEGTLFSVSLSAQSLYADIDKTLLAKLSGVEVAGIYAAATRLIDAAFAPVRSLIFASYPQFFRAGLDGLPGSLGLARRLTRISLAYTVVASAVLYFGAPVLPWLLGRAYSGSVEAVRWLTLLLWLRSAHYFVANALTGAGYQAVRSAIQVGAAIVSVLLGVSLIPSFGWRGAAVTALVSNGLLLVCLRATCWRVTGRGSQRTDSARSHRAMGRVVAEASVDTLIQNAEPGVR